MHTCPHTLPTTTNRNRLDELCAATFESLSRADQRRWARTYVGGLVLLPGRKSIRRIAEQVAAGSAQQCLQQFVNQSPWDWAPVRHALAQMSEQALSSRAWVVEEVEFPKDGRHSVGVETQYAPRAQRTMNCQVGLSTWLAGDGGAVPVNWRLMLPAQWDADATRREKAHLPATERHRPRSHHILDSLDEMIVSWGLPPRAVVCDLRHEHLLAPLVGGLEERGLSYALRITPRTPVAAVHGRPLRAGDLVRPAAREVLALRPHRSGLRGPATSLVVAQATVPGTERMAPKHEPYLTRPRRVVARRSPWSRGRREPGELWMTNLSPGRMPELLGVLDTASTVDRELPALRADSGLDHFEGRSYRGWHHHVTLASIAHAHRVLHRPTGEAQLPLAAPATGYGGE